jgi:hypothetical protein
MIHINATQSFASKLIYNGRLNDNGQCTGTLDLRKYRSIRVFIDFSAFGTNGSSNGYYLLLGYLVVGGTKISPAYVLSEKVYTQAFDTPGEYMDFCKYTSVATSEFGLTIYGSD